MTKKRIDQIQIGDRILPPDRELRLWMRRRAQERNIPISDIYMTVTAIEDGQPTKRGAWLKITGKMSDNWDKDFLKPSPFRFLAQPHVMWPLAETVS